jgi:hypothetical protein
LAVPASAQSRRNFVIETAVDTALLRTVACEIGARTFTFAPLSKPICCGAAAIASATAVSPAKAAATATARREVFKRKLTLLYA